jgi:hypothetical protein
MCIGSHRAATHSVGAMWRKTLRRYTLVRRLTESLEIDDRDAAG